MPYISVPGRKPRVPDTFLSEDDEDGKVPRGSDFDPTSMVDFFKEHEKSVPYMYRDTAGYVTVGVGHMIPSREAAAELPFQYQDPLIKERRPATRDEIQRGYDQLPGRVGQRNNLRYETYEPTGKKLAPLYLGNDGMDQILKKDIQAHYDDVRQKFDDFDTYPVPARRALLDMNFNMGGRFNAAKWPKLFGAVKNRQWSDAGDFSHRPQVRGARNETIKNLFYDAWREEMAYGQMDRNKKGVGVTQT